MAVLKDLIVHGPSRFLNKAYFDSINADSVEANKGIFNKLIAKDSTLTNATVVGLLDVQGEMHTNSWSNSNIATIDGNFYITPTAVSADGTDATASGYTPTGTITYNNTNYTQMTITGTFDTSQLTLDGTGSIAWPANSYVIVTGDVLVGNEWYPLGTIRGKLSAQVAANTGSKTFTIIPIGTQIISGEVGNVSLTDGNGHKPLALEAIRTAGATLTSLKLRKVKISMTSRGSGSDQYALGIYMTAMGGNKKTFLDIYGGSNKNGVDISSTIGGATYQSGAFAKPTVRIGNLLGLPAFSLPNNTSVSPTGWGIYTTNGFFSGTIVSTQGKIGNFTLGTAIYSGTDSMNSNATGIYLGTDGIRNYKAADKYVNIQNGVITAKGVDLSGELTASKLTINSNATISDTNGLIRNDAIEVGGRNLLKAADVAKYEDTTSSGTLDTSNYKTSGTVIYTRGAVSNEGFYVSKYELMEPNTEYTISFKAKCTSGSITKFFIYATNPNNTDANAIYMNGTKISNRERDVDYSHPITMTNGTYYDFKFVFKTKASIATGSYLGHIIQWNKDVATAFTVEMTNLKWEKGNKATDWTPAPEDVASDIDGASKVAKNYLKFTDASGLDIGYTGDANAHGRTNIQGDGMRIYDSDDAVNPVARFTVNGGQIGKDGESRLVLNSDGQTLINDNIVWFGVNKSGNPTVDDVPTQESFASNTAQNPSVTLKNTPNGRISVITQGQYMWLGSTYYTSRIEDTFTYGRTSSKSHSERINVTTAASVTWTVNYDGNKTITISDSSHGGTATHRVIIQTVTYTVGAGTAVDLGIMTFGSTREKPTGNGSVLLGRGLASEGNGQVVLGRYNKPDKNNDNALIIGNGSSSSYTNAFSVGWDGDLTAAGGLTLHNHSSTVGTIKDAFRNVNQNINSGTWFTVCALSLEAGVWLVKCNVTFKDITSPGGTYAIGITTSSSGEPWGAYIFGPSATTSADKNVQYTQIVAPSSTQTYYLRARQSSGEQGTIYAGAAAGNNSIRAVRII